MPSAIFPGTAALPGLFKKITNADDGWPAVPGKDLQPAQFQSATLYITAGKPLSRFIERMFLRHKEIFLMKNGTHYSLKDTD